MANPNPLQTQDFIAQQIKPTTGEAFGRVIGVRFPAAVDEALQEMGSAKTDFIRAAVQEKLAADGLLSQEFSSDRLKSLTEIEKLPEPEPVEKTSKRPARRRKAATTSTEDKAEFRTGQTVRNPAGWRGWIVKLLDDGKAIVDWEGQISGDEIPLHLLRAID
ncbi:hypothetical protein HY772_10180 [Candidatus Woesearchaeota archaeon]|nr:hypothetical protein [Candidatus Woesearchaeota archaeon]